VAGPDKRPEANRRRLATTLREQIAARRTIADQVLNGIITPLLLTCVVILANRSSALRAAKNGPIFKTVATLCVAVGSVLWFVVLVESLFGLG
jgi:Mn2+/Fe2+ NRAMP family transporter